jgi:hypothetical protein
MLCRHSHRSPISYSQLCTILLGSEDIPDSNGRSYASFNSAVGRMKEGSLAARERSWGDMVLILLRGHISSCDHIVCVQMQTLTTSSNQCMVIHMCMFSNATTIMIPIISPLHPASCRLPRTPCALDAAEVLYHNVSTLSFAHSSPNWVQFFSIANSLPSPSSLKSRTTQVSMQHGHYPL